MLCEGQRFTVGPARPEIDVVGDWPLFLQQSFSTAHCEDSETHTLPIALLGQTGVWATPTTSAIPEMHRVRDSNAILTDV